MKKVIFITVLLMCVGAASANMNLNLTRNGELDGGTSWLNNATAIYFYVDGSDSIVSWYGWWQTGIWQDTGTVFAPNVEYTMTVVARKGGPGTAGALLSIIDVDNGWSHMIDATVNFQLSTYGNGTPWEVLEATFDTTDYPEIVGHRVGVGVNVVHDGVNDWVHVNSVSLSYFCAIPTLPAHDDDLDDDLNRVGDIGDNGIDVQLEWTTMRDPLDAPDYTAFNPDVTAHFVSYVENEPNFLSPNVVTYTVDENAVGETGSLLLEDLTPDSKYYWRVDEGINGHPMSDPNTVVGVVRGFETIPEVAVILDQPEDVLVEDGGSAEFSVEIFSQKPTTFEWYHSTDLIQDTVTDVKFGTDANTVTLSDIYIADGDAHTYVYCVVDNGGGEVFSDMVLVEIERQVAGWSMDGNLNDSENGWTGTYTGSSAVYGDDMNGTAEMALSLVADPNHVQIIGSEEYFNFYHLGLTANCWIKSDGQTWAAYVCKQDREGYDPWAGYVFETNNLGQAMFNIRGVGGVTSTTVVNDNVWHMVTATFDATSGDMAVYVDGEMEGAANFPDAVAIDADSPVTIGAEQVNGGTPFAGLIDQVEIYTYAKSAMDVLDMYNMSVEPDKILCIADYAANADIWPVDAPDCKIDINDFAEMAAGWLTCGLYPSCP